MSRRLRVPKPHPGYPAKPKLSDTDMTNALRFGPVPKWFEPFAARRGYAAPSAPFRFALVHMHGSPVWGDMRMFWDEEKMRWAMEDAYRWHHNNDCPGCQGLFYLTPVPEVTR